MTTPTVDYAAPPLVEVVFGRQFRPLMLSAIHVGDFWTRLGRDALPNTSEQPPLPALIETPAGPLVAQQAAASRHWFRSSDEETLVQLQCDRFLVNWLSGPYPRFVPLKERFDSFCGLLEAFAFEHLSTRLEDEQFELSYINHIPWHPDWRSQGEAFRNVCPDLAWGLRPRFLPSPTTGEVRFVFDLPSHAGRLRITLKDALRTSDQTRIVVMELTARGMLPNRNEWFGLAHEWIVRGFSDLTSEEMHRQWRRRS